VIDRQTCLAWFHANRRRSRRWFDMIAPEAYEARPIPLRHPIVFYEGHVAAFNVNTLLKRGLGRAGVHPELEQLFERGIDPLEERAVAPSARWPARAQVLVFGAAADEAVQSALAHDAIDDAANPVLRRGLAISTMLEHEAMHHETLLYMFHRLPHAQKRPPAPYRAVVGGTPPRPHTVRIPAGVATLGADADAIPFGWDNEFPLHRVDVDAFEIDAFDVTNADYLAFVEAGGYAIPDYWSSEDWSWRAAHGFTHPAFWERDGGRWFWRGLFARVPLPSAWPVYVSHAEASAYARWCGRRLPSEAEYHRAAYGTPEGRERAFPWGDLPPDRTRGNFDWRHWDPVPVGAFPAGVSAWGVHDLVGNGWEWTSTVFGGFPGFRPMPSYPEYSADFFDGRHYVLKGASPATASPLIRRSWRNWFQPRYPYLYASFRCASS
jgi:gamma-glutamyl hercynylcysteine S-oxide synthase